MPIPDPNITKPPAPGPAPSSEGTASPSDTPSKLLKSADMPERLGRYRILKKLGQGGMGAVYLAHDSQLDRQVALKVPHFGPEADEDLIERFYREARAAATLHHPNLCPIYDVGTHDGLHYLTMAYIEGHPLSGIATPGKGLPARQVAIVVRKLALALAEAHAKGIVHRDLKPANVMINQRKEPVIMDFGLARRANQNETRLTKSGAIVGTPAYMAPEQLSGAGEAGAPADIYSLGVMMYELLTGRLPFEGPMMAVLGQILTEEPEPPSQHRVDLPKELETICLTAMAKQVEYRFASMTALATALAQYLSGAGSTPPASTPLDVQVSAPRTGQKAAAGKSERSQATQFPMTEKLATASPSRKKTKRHVKSPIWSKPLFWVAAGGALVLALAILLLSGDVFQVRTKMGVVVLTINEPGAKVFVDDELKITLTSPSDKEPIKIEVPEGKHVMKVTKGGFVTETKEFTLRAGTPEEIRVTLRPEPGEIARLKTSQRDLGAFTMTKDGKTWSVPLPERFTKVEAIFYQGNSNRQTLNAAWNGHLRVNGQDVVRFKKPGGNNDFIFHNYVDGKDYTEVNDYKSYNSGSFIDITKLVRPGDNEFYFYHEQKRELAMGVLLRVTEHATPGQVEQPVVKDGTAREDWLSLFNGKDLTGWKSHPDAPGDWKVENGILIGRGPQPSNLFSVRNDYADFHFFVEARINPAGNSGQLFRVPEFKPGDPHCYEAQIDSGKYPIRTGSFMVLVGKFNPADGAYVKNAPVPPDTWFTQEVIAQGNKFVVKVNDKVTAEFVDKENRHRRGFLALQVLAPETVVEFRQVKVKELKSAPASAQDYEALFNGKDLTGWKTHPNAPGDWKVESGILVGRGPQVNHLFTERGDYADFHFFIEARINAKGNSGQNFRVQQIKPGILHGYEAQIDCGSHSNKTGTLYVQGGTTKQLDGVYVKEVLVPPDTWFTQEVIALGNRIIIKINDKVVTDFVDKNNTYRKGHLALQVFDPPTKVEFRQVKVKELTVAAAAAQPRVRALTELNTPGWDAFPWLSDDGLTIYWEVRAQGVADTTKSSVWTASRKNLASPFENKRVLLAGRHPTLSKDQLRLIGLEGEFVFEAIRPTLSAPFNVIGKWPNPNKGKSPCLSADGLTLYLNRPTGPGTTELVFRSRKSLDLAWNNPQKLVEWADPASEKLTWPFVFADGLALLCCHEGAEGKLRIMVWTRTKTNEPFKQFRYLDVPGEGVLTGRSPRYLPLTRELFFTAPSDRSKPWDPTTPADLWVLENMDLPGALAQTRSAPSAVFGDVARLAFR